MPKHYTDDKVDQRPLTYVGFQFYGQIPDFDYPKNKRKLNSIVKKLMRQGYDVFTSTDLQNSRNVYIRPVKREDWSNSAYVKKMGRRL